MLFRLLGRRRRVNYHNVLHLLRVNLLLTLMHLRLSRVIPVVCRGVEQLLVVVVVVVVVIERSSAGHAEGRRLPRRDYFGEVALDEEQRGGAPR